MSQKKPFAGIYAEEGYLENLHAMVDAWVATGAYPNDDTPESLEAIGRAVAAEQRFCAWVDAIILREGGQVPLRPPQGASDTQMFGN